MNLEQVAPCPLALRYLHDGFETVDAAAKVARKEWEDNMGEEIPSTFRGSESSLTGPWESLVISECSPELLFLAGWMTQTFFLVDDKADRRSRKEAHEQLNMPLDHVFRIVKLKPEPATSMERLFLPRLRQMLDYDYEGASLLFEGWRDWLQQADTRDENTLESLEAYLKFREMNVAFLPYSHLTIFVLRLNITREERQAIDHFRNLAARNFSLINDYWSWAKEIRESYEGVQRMMNAVTMRMRQVSEMESLQIVKDLAIECE
ncbi:hypothetical protein N7448_003904 [Penicillium atrosanguineum]|nr:hypothetical protein N7526_009708 [Penicillium atrosanguineum]KAJ5140496.1 hypothetical protein N7448_003904 [Penicillium atrosanguineum]